jgi:hypothetical protein
MNALELEIPTDPRFVRDTARVYRQGLRTLPDGREFTVAALTNAQVTRTAYLPNAGAVSPSSLYRGEAIEFEGRIEKADDSVALIVSRYRRLSGAEDHARRLELLPSALCPKPNSVYFLYRLIDRLTIPPLVDFLTDALCEPANRDRFLIASASFNAHHNWPGGLIEHSVEVAQWVARFRDIPGVERELGVAAALVHDIAKTRTHQRRNDSLGELLPHDALTLEILAPALRRLDARWRDGAIAMRFLLSRGQAKTHFTKKVELHVSLVLDFADQFSAHSDKNKRAFRASQRWSGFANFGPQRFWRPKPPGERVPPFASGGVPSTVL